MQRFKVKIVGKLKRPKDAIEKHRRTVYYGCGRIALERIRNERRKPPGETH